MANTVQSAMAPSIGPPPSSRRAVQQVGVDAANTIDLTGLDETDNDTSTLVAEGFTSKVKTEGRQSPPGCSSETPKRLPEDANTMSEREHESSSDDNNIIRAIRGHYQPYNPPRVEKRKDPPGKDDDAAGTPTINTSIFLNLHEKEWKPRKYRKMLGHYTEKFRRVPSSHSKPAAEQTRAQPGSQKQPLKSTLFKDVTQTSQEQRASSADAVNNHRRKSKTRHASGKQASKTVNNVGVQPPTYDLTGDINPIDSEVRVPGSKASSDGVYKRDAVPLERQQTTTSREPETRANRANNVGSASRVNEDEVHDATAQFKALESQYDQQKQLVLIDADAARRKAAPSSTAAPNPQSRPPRPSRPLRRPQAPSRPSAPRQPQAARQPPVPGPSQTRDPGTSRPLRKVTDLPRSRPRPYPEARAGSINRDEFQDVAVQMQTLQAQLPQPSQTTLIDRLPSGSSQPKQRALPRRVSMPLRDKQSLTSVSDFRASQRRRQIERDVNKQSAHESAEQREQLIEQKFNNYLSNRRRKELARCKTRNEEFWTYGGGDLGSDSEEEEPEPFARRVPLSHALETTQSEFVTQYVVFASEPHSGCDHEHGKCLRRRQAFDEVELANAYAEVLLKGPSRPPRRGKNASKARKNPAAPSPSRIQIDSYEETYHNGMLTARLTLVNGKSIYCEVRRECQAVGSLNPDALRKKWAKEEFIQLHRRRYDVWLIKVIPTEFIERERQDKDEQERNRQREELETINDQETASGETSREEGHDEVEEREIVTALEGDELRAALASLPTPNSSPPHSNDKAEDDDMRDESGSDTASDAEDDISRSSTPTLQGGRPPSPEARAHPACGHPARGRGPNPWLFEEYEPILCGSFTDLRSANDRAFDVAVLHWKPRTLNMDAQLHYRDHVKTAVEREREVTDMDSERADIVFPVPPWDGHDDHRPWGFVHSRVMVQETVLEGPRDVGAELVREEEEEEGREEREEEEPVGVRRCDDDAGRKVESQAGLARETDEEISQED